MSEGNTIVCPNCHTAIDLDELAEHRYTEELRRNAERLEQDYKAREEAIKEDLRKKAVEWAEKKSEEKMREKELERKELEEQVAGLRKSQEEAVKNELEIRKKARELEEKQKQMDLELARRTDEARKEWEEKQSEAMAAEKKRVADEVAAQYEKRLKDQEEQSRILKKSLEEANRQAIQGSQQIQGESLEHELGRRLREAFPNDRIDDVPTGALGADLIQTVRDGMGRDVGIVLWESKNTKQFSPKWIEKLRDDRVLAKADLCVIVSSALPDGIDKFGQTGGMWVSELPYAVALAHALRNQLLALSEARASMEGRDEKMALLYDYLASQEFRSKITNVVEAFETMRADLDTEKRSMQRIWAKREKELERVINNTTLIYGDMQGIMGRRLAPIPALELNAGDEADDDTQSMLIA